jgi:small conductance mechanosensitive channel
MTRLIQIIHQDFLNPAKPAGAIFYAIIFFLAAVVATGSLRVMINRVLQRERHRFLDPTLFGFLTQLAQTGVYLIFLILYMHLIPPLHNLATAFLAGAGVASIVIGLAAQNTLGNLVAGIAVLLYRPFHVGDMVQVGAPMGHETGIVERISLGYTILVTTDQRRIMVPNSVILSQTTVNLTQAITK